ncbi:MFS transporter [Dokdonella sp. MW10]|uniref:MFS transporter n=1 Tax=Dokdonella sp. MW10 TaxID=2992926 RepID=UPI003F806700
MATPASSARLPVALYALTAGAFGIGTTEFVIMGLLTQVANDLGVTVAAAGLLISGYALGVFVGAPLLTLATGKLPRKAVLVGLMVVFTLGNLACALAPDYATLMAARVVTSLAHGTFFGVGAVVATGLVAADRKASAISIMFTGLTVATLLGVPAGAWLGLHFGWRATFWAVAAIGVVAIGVITTLVPRDHGPREAPRIATEIAAVAKAPVLLGLAMTVLGFGGVFTVYTYIEPILLQVTRLSEASVSPVLLVFGVGMILGNVLGGRLADRRLATSLLVTLAALAVVLAVFGVAMTSAPAIIAATGLLGVAAFATVSPMQLWVLQKAGDAGGTLASSLNIGAFNLGNAFGAWLGGVVIVHGGGLASVGWVAAIVTLAGLGVAVLAIRSARLQAAAPHAACPAT